jgi:hypothetical protein
VDHGEGRALAPQVAACEIFSILGHLGGEPTLKLPENAPALKHEK